MSNVFRIGMTAADNAVHFGYVQDDEEQEDFVDSVKNIINDAFTTARTISEESPIYLTQNTLAPLGTLLDRIKDCGIINTETYNNVVAFASRKLKQITANFVPGNLIDYVNNSLVTNLNNVTSWTAEMTKIDNALNILRDKDKGILGTVEQGHDLRTGYSIHISMSETTLNNIGTFLDVLETSELFGGTANIYDSTNTTYASTSITRLFANILDYVHDQIVSNTNSNLTDMLSIISDMQDNIIRCGHRITDNNFWNTEISKVSPLISSLYSILDDSNSSGRFELSNTLGIDLDKAKHSALLGGNTTLKIVDVAMDRVKNMILGENYSDSGENNLNDKINGLFVDIKANLEDPDTETLMQDDNDFWSKEIVCFKSLQKLSEDSNSISDISSCLILAQDIDLAYTSQLIPDTSLDSIIVSVIRNTKTKDATKTIDVKINELIEDIASDIESPTFFYSTTNPDGYSRENFWTIELNHINNLKSLDLDNSTSGNLANNIRNIGTELDKVVYGYTDGDDTIRGSYLITEIRVRNILSTAITAMKNNIVGSFDNSMATIIGSAVDSINKNIYDTTNSNPICVSISSFGYELGNIATLTDLEISGSIFSVPTGTEEERSAHTAAINAQLASIGNTIDSIAFNTIGENGCIIYDDDKNNSRIVTRAILNTLIKDTFGLALNSTTDNTYQSVFNSLITAIQTNIANVGNKVFSWKKELAFVTTLTDMNQDKEYSLANAGDNIAVNIDAIAFNVYTKNNNIGYNDLEYYQYDTDKLLGGYDTVNQNNSLFITREILKVAVAGLVADFKYNSATPGSKEEITNDLIDNISNTINTEDYNTDGSKYNNYATLFTALNTEKQAITDSFESFTQNNNVIDNDTAENIDLFLHARQNVLICGVVITRKMANLILTNVHDKIEESITAYPGMNSSDVENTQTMQYINTLRTHYTGSNANSTTPENYNTPGTYNNPFRTVYATYETDRNNNFGMTP